jgi:hypothetical protein
MLDFQLIPREIWLIVVEVEVIKKVKAELEVKE